jgi:hypothetical protein
MKKFEVTFEGKLYDYVSKKMMLEYLSSIFPRAEVNVKTIRQKKTPVSETRVYLNEKSGGKDLC